MSPKNSLLLSLLSLSSVLAAPMEYRLEDIQCRCLSFSTNAKPTLCTNLKPYSLDWQVAYSLASDNDLKVQFASKTTITKVLSIPKPLPSSILQSLYEDQASLLGPVNRAGNENKMVCGLGNEVKHIGGSDRSLEPELHYAGLTLAWVMLLLIVYLVGECLWTKLRTRNGSIKLEGDEKTLT